VANSLTITGSIGVIMHGYNYRGLLDKLGVRPEVFKSGRFKDRLRGDKAELEIQPEERRMIQTLIDETYAQFKRVVSDGRNDPARKSLAGAHPLATNWTEYADGRVLSGRQALDLGFVDELGNFRSAVDRTRTLAQLGAANLVEYRVRSAPFSLLRLLGQGEARRLTVDIGIDLPRLKLGHMYFLFLPGGS